MKIPAKVLILIHKANRSRGILQGHIKLLQELIPEAEVVDVSEGFGEYENAIAFKMTNDGFLGSEFLDSFAEYLKSFKRVFCCVDDYTTPLATQIRNSLRESQTGIALTTIRKSLEEIKNLKSWNWTDKYHYVNLNAASYQPIENSVVREQNTLFYHGSFRPDRERYFRKYLLKNDLYKTVISCSSERAMMKFKDAGIYPEEFLLSKDPLTTQISRYSWALYIEDDYSHRVFCSPANRFYENLSAGTPMLFDISCENTFKEAGLLSKVSPFFVNSVENVKSKMSLDKALEIQNSFQTNPRDDLKNQLLSILRSYL